jgi:dihydroorotase
LSIHGAKHYGLDLNKEKVILVKKAWDVPKKYEFGGSNVTPLRGGETIAWTLMD